MIIIDPIADTLIRIKNGYTSGKRGVEVPYSKLQFHLCKLLSKEGYIMDVSKKERALELTLKYEGRKPVLTDVKRISKPSLRVYKGYKNLPRVLNNLGIAIISTPQGLMTEKEARKKKLGGEVMAEVW